MFNLQTLVLCPAHTPEISTHSENMDIPIPPNTFKAAIQQGNFQVFVILIIFALLGSFSIGWFDCILVVRSVCGRCCAVRSALRSLLARVLIGW
jgi:hypothetical protein